jgi:hypothetical protein
VPIDAYSFGPEIASAYGIDDNGGGCPEFCGTSVAAR